ncbi:tRNA 2-selenouridine synthase [Kroppenstedtia guangzhouensis]|uniref:tRNA 2-selenouridine synthase n=1 Tax=Kroppenstedtia guangzhouensis TaxID=1274356 RepID=A0ABQ1G7E6_9BACL|nr:tRNA 2-selenouridine(34) synthase MnmH [Kroppenstedtia guangzhouensis]GGA38167.1 tRNA 2-selenouridine synthase [Kroppenstedtia guangzhouensis]
MKDIEIDAATKEQGIRWIDVRSPGEFETATIPGAVNVPLFDNEERARIGTVYKQQGKKEALRLGMEIVSPKIPRLVESVQEQSRGRTPLLFCWRGGMRSRSMAVFLDLVEVPALRLKGGYRAYREYVVQRLSNYTLKPRLIVLHGLTGVGKTAILHRLRESGLPVLDLEELAGHRGSAFGSLGEIRPRNQRMFDSLLLEVLEAHQEAPYLFMEAESKRIGRVHMPDFLERAKEVGIPVLVEASMDTRVHHILDSYLTDREDTESFRQNVLGALARIERRFSPDIRTQLYEWARREEYSPMVRTLLREHYDPRYRHTQDQYEKSFALRICSDDLVRATENLKLFYQHLQPAQTHS